MTITTARLARAIALAYRRPLAAPLALSVLLAVPVARAVDLDAVKSRIDAVDVVKTGANSWRFVPSITVRQIYTDNVNHQAEQFAESQFLTELSPGLMVNHKSRRLVLDGEYRFNAYLNANKNSGARHSSNQLNGRARAELVDDLFFVDASARIFQQGISPFAAVTDGDDYVGANRATVKTWQISPYLVQRYGRVATSQLRYVHDSVKSGYTGFGDTTGDTLSLRINSGSAWDDFGWGVSASDQKIHDPARNDSRIQAASVDLSYQLFSTLSLTASAVHDQYDYESLGGANGGRGGTAGFRWTPSRRTSVQAAAGHRYYGPTRSLSALHRTRRTAWNLSYDDSVTTTRANFLLAASVDPTPGLPGTGIPGAPAAGSLGDLFTPDGPPPPVVTPVPPVLLPSVPGNVNFFSNRFFLQEQLRASVALRGARTTAVLGAFKVRREALSVRDVDTDILGSPVDTINDNISQVGVNATLTYRLAPRTGLSLSTTISDNESLTTGFKARSSAIRINVRHELGRTMSGVVELGRVQGLSGLTSGSRYTANSVSASLNMQL